MSKKLIDMLEHEARMNNRSEIGHLIGWAAEALTELREKLKAAKAKAKLTRGEREALARAAKSMNKAAAMRQGLYSRVNVDEDAIALLGLLKRLS
jgi:hypothetical protein